jgi:peroxiredoxin
MLHDGAHAGKHDTTTYKEAIMRAVESEAGGFIMSIEVGGRAPDFTLTDQDRQPVTLSAQRGRPVVLAFFPAAFSSVCTKELCTFRDSLAALNAARAQVFGISVDTFFTLKAFQTDQKLAFPLLSDFNKQVIRDFGVYNEDMIGLKGISKRAVFVIDKDGIVRYREVLDDARNEPDYDKVLKTVASLE